MSITVFAHVPPSRDVRDEAFDRALRIAQGLYPHQVEGVAFLLSRRRAILADDMGLGKTRQAIVSLREAEPAGPYLVVCPAAVKLNWAREIHAVDQNASVAVLGRDAFPEKAFTGWVIVNYDILNRHIDDLTSLRWSGIVYDEAHYLKNRKSKRSVLGRKLADQAGTDPVVYCLTGTPLTNRPRDLFPLLELVRHPASRSFLTFAKRYCDAVKTEYGWVTDGASNLEELAVQLKGVMLRRSKNEVLDLPPKTRQWLEVEGKQGLGISETRQVLEILLGVGRGEASDGINREKLLATLTKLRRKLAVAKTSQTIEHVANVVEQGDKALVFSGFNEPLDLIEEKFGDACVSIRGATPTAKRQEIVDRFQNDDTVRVLAANIIAGGVGLNLTAARQVVFNDLDWVPANHWQAEDRAYRIGQSQSVLVTYLVASGTVDEFVRNVLKTKARLVEAVVDGKAVDGETGGDVLRELERLVSGLSPRITDTIANRKDPDVVKSVLEELKSHYASDGATLGVEATSGDRTLPVPEEVLRLLAETLAGPTTTTYEVRSNSDPNLSYQITASGADLECSCPGFGYRGTCSHERKLRTALEKGKLPAGYKAVQ